MEIKKIADAKSLTLALKGRLDTVTASELEAVVQSSLDDMTEVVFDLAELEYISSAGLRVLLVAQKKMNKQGSMIVKNVKDEIKEVFEITGFSEILTIE